MITLDTDAHRAAVPCIPDHALVRLIGKGSYGEVWLAQNLFGVFRAVKIVRRSSFDRDAPFEREFNGIEKFEPVSRCHPAFVAILHVGQNREEGYFYYVMELGDDQTSGQQIVPERYSAKTLSSEINERGWLALPDCVRIGLAISDALATLHKAGLVHRDIKPANIIFVNGQPKLADIGLVHTISSAVTFVGTQGYMPPEGPGSVQADIYALGKLLYELSTGNDRQQFPELPDFVAAPELARGFSEFNEVLVKACDSDLRRRYVSAEQLHGDLQLIEQGGSLRRLRVLERRFRVLTRVGVIAALILAIGGSVAMLVFQQHQRVRQAKASQVAISLAYGSRLLDESDTFGALPWFVDALQSGQEDPAAARTHRTRVGSVLEYSPRLVRCWWHSAPVQHGAFSPDGRLIAFGDTEGTVRIIQRDSGATVLTLRHGTNQAISMVDFSPRGDRLLTAGEDRTVRVWNLMTTQEVVALPHRAPVYSARFSPDGNSVLTAVGGQGDVRLWNCHNGELLRSFAGHSNVVRSASFSADGKRIVSASHDGFCIVWDVETGSILKRIPQIGWAYATAFSPDGQWIVTGGSDSKAQVWNASSGSQILPPIRHHMQVCAAQFSPDRRLLATASYDSAVYLWDMEREGAPVGVLRHGAQVWDVAFSPDARYVLTVSWDHTVRLWDVSPPSFAAASTFDEVSANGSGQFNISSNRVTVVSVVASNRIAEWAAPYPVASVLCSASGAAFLAIPSKRSETSMLTGLDVGNNQSLRLPREAVTAFAKCWIADGAQRAFSIQNQELCIWELATGRMAGKWRSKAPLTDLAISPNGGKVAVWDSDSSGGNHANIIDAATAGELMVPLAHALPVSTAVFSRDGTRLLTGCRDTKLTHGYGQVWDVTTGKPTGDRLMHGDGVIAVAFSPDGKLAATGGEDNIAQVWDVESGRHLPPLQHEHQVVSVQFSADGRWLVTGSFDGSARLWEVSTSAPLTPYLRQPGAVLKARFAADASAVVVTGNKRTRVYALPAETRPVAEVKLIAGFLAGGAVTNALERQLISQWAEQNGQSCARLSDKSLHLYQIGTSEAGANLHGSRFHRSWLKNLETNGPVNGTKGHAAAR